MAGTFRIQMGKIPTAHMELQATEQGMYHAHQSHMADMWKDMKNMDTATSRYANFHGAYMQHKEAAERHLGLSTGPQGEEKKAGQFVASDKHMQQRGKSLQS